MLSIQALVQAVVILICLGLVLWLLNFLLDYCAPPEPFRRVGKVVLMVFGVLICIAVLLNLAGIAVVRW